jgi:hypothetical protein
MARLYHTFGDYRGPAVLLPRLRQAGLGVSETAARGREPPGVRGVPRRANTLSNE